MMADPQPPTTIPSFQLLQPTDDASAGSNHTTTNDEIAQSPLIICFHGSGESCSPSWDSLVTKLITEIRCRVLLCNRGSGNHLPATIAAQIWDYLHGRAEDQNRKHRHEHENGKKETDGPYLLIAHSYGGAFARAFIQHEHDLLLRSKKDSTEGIMGLVLVETGQEGGLDAALDAQQIRRVVMGKRPVSVIRGNSLLGKWRELEERERLLATSLLPTSATTLTLTLASPTTPALDHTPTPISSASAKRRDNVVKDVAMQRSRLAAERDMLERVDAEDERLKRRQLGLSKTSRYVHISDCGHHVIRDRPDAVVDAVRWVLENAEDSSSKRSLWERVWGVMQRFSVR
ncbi:Alpha/Beta hydrolase protein [Nemania sp. FL0916]|nr:Alpha/Beta hydrolase protein [Nemania sp. FL0916]